MRLMVPVKTIFRIIAVSAYVFIFSDCYLFAQEDSLRKEIMKTVQAELRLHPKSGLIDLYKNFFQGKFGPGHMIRNSASAEKYLRQETDESSEYDSVLWQPVGTGGQYFRVNLSLVKDKKIGLKELLKAFIQSANEAAPVSVEKWKAEWEFILKVIEEMDLRLSDFRVSKQKIEKNLLNGIPDSHHSQIYRDLYHPHYRIISKEHFDKIPKPLLQGK